MTLHYVINYIIIMDINSFFYEQPEIQQLEMCQYYLILIYTHINLVEYEFQLL